MIFQDYLIAGHRIRIEGEALVKIVGAIRGFSVFSTTTDDEPLCRFIEMPCDVDLTAMLQDTTQMPGVAKVLYEFENEGVHSCFGTNAGGDYLFGMVLENRRALLLEVAQDGREARFGGDFSERLLRFACWVAYGLATVGHKTVAIHTSTIEYGDRAVLFLGESGTGKSTHTRLWRENIEGAQLLNDDSPIIRIVDGQAVVYGSPWSGKTPCYRNDHFQLAACVRLSQAPHNRIKRLGVLAAYAAIHPSCPPEFAYDERLYDFVSEFISDILTTVPVYHLECLPDADAARLSCNTIFGSCER